MNKYSVTSACIAEVTLTGTISVVRSGEVIADLPTRFLANAPIIHRIGKPPRFFNVEAELRPSQGIEALFLNLLSSPTVASKEWVYRQYDHEVGIRTIAKPGDSDAALLKLPNGKLAAVKVDGNALFCDLDPYVGGASVLAEACRNIVAVGAEPIAFLDHCQFGDPNDENIFGAFSSAIKGIADLAKVLSLPCIGGKVSFYNQDEETKKAIKSSPVISVLGLVQKPEHVTKMGFKQDGEAIIVVGTTKRELGGSEYYRLLNASGNAPPSMDFELERRTQDIVLACIRANLVTACHDCSKGGFGIAIAEMAIAGAKGATINLRNVPAEKMREDELLFSESNSRFILTSNRPDMVKQKLVENGIPSALIGEVGGGSLEFTSPAGMFALDLVAARTAYSTALERIMEPWQK